MPIRPANGPNDKLFSSEAYRQEYIDSQTTSNRFSSGGISPVIDPSNFSTSTLLKALTTVITNNRRRVYFRAKGSDRLRTLGHVQTPYELTRALWQAFKIHRPGLVFEPAYPSYVLDREDAEILRAGRAAPEIPEEIITWSVLRRAPGSLDGKPFQGTKEIKPRIREELVYDPRITSLDPPQEETHAGPTAIGPNHELARVLGVEIKGQTFDNLIQFDIWSKNNRKAEELAQYLEDVMLEFSPMLTELGVLKSYFHSRIRDEHILSWKNGLVNRSLIYYFRLEKVTAVPVREIRQINIDMQFHKVMREIDERGFNDLITDYENRVIHNWINRNRATTK